jgi:hypothetical protein
MERAVSFVASLGLALAIAGCSLPRAVLGAPDGGSGAMDAFVGIHDTGVDALAADAGLDAFVAPFDTGVDAFVPPVDMGTDAFVSIDAYVTPDIGHDAYIAPDAFAGDASTPCDRAFGSAPGYHVCGTASTSSCTFYVAWPSNDQSCNDACGAGRCTHAVGNADRTMCTTQGGAFPCDQTFHDAICTCTP